MFSCLHCTTLLSLLTLFLGGDPNWSTWIDVLFSKNLNNRVFTGLFRHTNMKSSLSTQSVWHRDYLIASDKALFSTKKYWYFLISPWKHLSGYSLAAPCWGASNEYPQRMFPWRNKEKYFVDTTSYLELCTLIVPLFGNCSCNGKQCSCSISPGFRCLLIICDARH